MTSGPTSRPGVLRSAAALLAVTAALCSPCRAAELTFRSSAGEIVAPAQMVPRLRAARLLLVGEVHGDRRHHAAQIELLRMLLDAGVPLAVGMETFGATGDAELARWSAGKLDAAALYRRFGADWSTAQWKAYRDLFSFIRERAVPLAGINGDEAVIRKVASDGFASLSDLERRGLPPGSCTVNPSYRRLLDQVLGGKQDEASFRSFCEAQTLRDAIMARNLLRLARRSKGSLVVGLTGVFHAWRPAVPAHLGQLGAGRVLVLLPEKGAPDALTDLRGQADYLWRLSD